MSVFSKPKLETIQKCIPSHRPTVISKLVFYSFKTKSYAESTLIHKRCPPVRARLDRVAKKRIENKGILCLSKRNYTENRYATLGLDYFELCKSLKMSMKKLTYLQLHLHHLVQ